MTTLSTRWITEFERQRSRGKHILLHGNIHDRFLWRGEYPTLKPILYNWFQDHGFSIVLSYNSVDRIQFANDATMRSSFLEKIGVSSPPPAVPVMPIDPKQPPPRNPDQGVARGEPPTIDDTPERALSHLRQALSEKGSSLAVVIELGDMFTADQKNHDEAERSLLIRLKACTLEAKPHNAVVFVAADLNRVSSWLHRDNPHLAIIHMGKPEREERRHFAMSFLQPRAGHSGFFGGEAIDLEKTAEIFTDLTDGFSNLEMNALGFTSHQQRIPASQMARLIDYHKFGLSEDPWEKLDAQKVREAETKLKQRVIGQDKAVEAVTSMLVRARVGLSMVGDRKSTRPKGTFFFVGPTGTGKTELAKSLSELVFNDDKALARFDMSEYREEHAAEKLTGAPPGFVGFDEGGQLTNRVLEHPHSILLFDEIEKAHARVLDKFLQILEDGRLTDGQGRTAYFHQSVIIFTSNIGASSIMGKVAEQGVDAFPYEAVDQHFQHEVTSHFVNELKRAELKNRLGDNVVVFDLLRPQYIKSIAQKFLNLLAGNAQEKFGLGIECDDSILDFVTQRMQEGDNPLHGGRRIKTLLETHVELPLNRKLFDMGTDMSYFRGRMIRLSLNSENKLDISDV